MVSDSKILANLIVNKLSSELKNSSLPSIKSIFVAGSYCRGDWLNCSSDLDLNIIIKNDCSDKEKDIQQIRAIVNSIVGDITFHAHCPGGIDYGVFNESDIPKTFDVACKPALYPYFSTLMFDLKQNNITLYGEEINNLLPESPNPIIHSKAWLQMLVTRIHSLPPSSYKIQFIPYKAILAAQLFFGDQTIHKYKLLELYQKNIPSFPLKWYGEIIIRNYLGSFYPERPAIILQHSEILNFVDELLFLVENSIQHSK